MRPWSSPTARAVPECLSLLPLEPAFYSLARGAASLERHIARMAPVVAEAPDLDTASFWSRWMRGMTGNETQPPVTAQALITANASGCSRPLGHRGAGLDSERGRHAHGLR